MDPRGLTTNRNRTDTPLLSTIPEEHENSSRDSSPDAETLKPVADTPPPTSATSPHSNTSNLRQRAHRLQASPISSTSNYTTIRHSGDTPRSLYRPTHDDAHSIPEHHSLTNRSRTTTFSEYNKPKHQRRVSYAARASLLEAIGSSFRETQNELRSATFLREAERTIREAVYQHGRGDSLAIPVVEALRGIISPTPPSAALEETQATSSTNANSPPESALNASEAHTIAAYLSSHQDLRQLAENRLSTLRLVKTLSFIGAVESALGEGIGLGMILAQSIYIWANALPSLNIADIQKSVPRATFMTAATVTIASAFFGYNLKGLLIESKEAQEGLSDSTPIELPPSYGLNQLTQKYRFEDAIIEKWAQGLGQLPATVTYKFLQYTHGLLSFLYTPGTLATLLAMMLEYTNSYPSAPDFKPDASIFKFYNTLFTLILAFAGFKLSRLSLEDYIKPKIYALSTELCLNIQIRPPLAKIPCRKYSYTILWSALSGMTLGSYLINQLGIVLVDLKRAHDETPLYYRNSKTDVGLSITTSISYAIFLIFSNSFAVKLHGSAIIDLANRLDNKWEHIKNFLTTHPQCFNNTELRRWFKNTENGTQADPVLRQGFYLGIEDLRQCGHQLATHKMPGLSWLEFFTVLFRGIRPAAFMMISLEIVWHVYAGFAGTSVTAENPNQPWLEEKWVLLISWMLSAIPCLLEEYHNAQLDKLSRMIEMRLTQTESWLEEIDPEHITSTGERSRALMETTATTQAEAPQQSWYRRNIEYLNNLWHGNAVARNAGYREMRSPTVNQVPTPRTWRESFASLFCCRRRPTRWATSETPSIVTVTP